MFLPICIADLCFRWQPSALRFSRPRNQRGSPLAPLAAWGPSAIGDLLADRVKALGVIRP